MAARCRRRERSGTRTSSPPARTVWPALMSALAQRRVQEARERRDLPEDREQRLVECRAGRQRRWKLGAGNEVLELQVLGGGMLFREAARHARQLVAGELAE